MIAAALLAVSLLLAAWSYLGYPRWIERRAARSPFPPRGDAASPIAAAEVLVAAADEERVIGGRVENLLAQEGVPGLTVRVGCDGCSDATAARAREAGGERVEVVEFGRRRGKAAVLNDLVAASRAGILVFTDANTVFEPGAVRALLAPFHDPRVGAVCGRLVLEADAAVAGAESAFWDRETRSKEAEGRLGVCLGANGAIYAARRELVPPLAEDTTSMDDFLIPARIARRGALVGFAPEAVAREGAGRDVAAEMSRRFRIGIGAGQVLRRERWLFAFRKRPLLSAVFLSRKAARWIAPLLALAAVAAGLADPRWRAAAAVIAGVLLLLILAARLRPRLSGAAGSLYYFVVLNVALAAGVVAGLAGYRRPAWRRAR
jgi:cellulose synthase/poly-beta-1,6-N-acetylglucosamine synthase-like glycosyltransferase